MERENGKARPGPLVITSVTLAIFGTLAVLVISGQQKRCARIERVADVRSLVTACVVYAKDRGEFPPDLQALIPDYFEDESVLLYDIGGKEPYLYRSGLRDSGNSREPLIISPPDEDGTRIVGYIGGHVTEHETLPSEILAEFE